MIREYTGWAEVVEQRLAGVNREAMLQIGIACCERTIAVWTQFDPTETRVFSALDALRHFKLEDLGSDDVGLRKAAVLECTEKAATAAMKWNGDPRETEGFLAFRANMAASSLSNLYWAAIKDENAELAVGFCLGLAWAATDYDPAERQFQDELISTVRNQIDPAGLNE